MEWKNHPVTKNFLNQLKTGIEEGKKALIYRTENVQFLQGYIQGVINAVELAESDE